MTNDSKPVKVHPDVKAELDSLFERGDTYSSVIAGLLIFRYRFLEFSNSLEPMLKSNKWRAERQLGVKQANTPGDGPTPPLGITERRR